MLYNYSDDNVSQSDKFYFVCKSYFNTLETIGVEMGEGHWGYVLQYVCHSLIIKTHHTVMGQKDLCNYCMVPLPPM